MKRTVTELGTCRSLLLYTAHLPRSLCSRTSNPETCSTQLVQSTGLRHFSQVSSHPWFQPPEALYRANNTIHMSLVTSASNRMVEAKVLRAFHPFTNYACILIQPLQYALDLPDRLFCKLADRRIGERTVPWSVDVERQFQTNLTMYIERSGGPPVLEYRVRSEDDPQWFDELEHWKYLNNARRIEQRAYKALTEAQKLGLIPKHFGNAIDGLLKDERLRRYGVSHNDLHSNNVILCHGTNNPVLIDWGRAGFHALAGKTFAARWMDSSMRQDFYSDIHKILKRSNGNIWHRFTTPLSNAWQMKRAPEWGWTYINRRIADLPKEQLEMLYMTRILLLNPNVG
ncbi:hypothetical protein CPB85DRAFT_1563841 [Mucidula mucida]|nr:hypothetical protein CPB85DRAFT_1563841 [Mucidula mucida]